MADTNGHVTIRDVYDLLEILRKDIYERTETLRREAANDRKEVMVVAERLRVSTEESITKTRAEHWDDFQTLQTEINGAGDGKGIKGRLTNLENALTVHSRVQVALTLIAASIAGWIGANK